MKKKRTVTGWIGKGVKISDIQKLDDIAGMITRTRQEWRDSIGWPPRKVCITIEEL